MASVVLSGDTSGSVSLTVPAVAGTNTVTVPAETGTVLTTASSGVCRAWVNFNGTGTVAIRASFNVSSITDNGTGNYTVNFTNALQDANYAATIGVSRTDNATTVDVGQMGTGARSTTGLRCFSGGVSGTAADVEAFTVAVFR